MGDLNQPDTIRSLEENTGDTLQDIDTSTDVLKKMPETQAIKAK